MEKKAQIHGGVVVFTNGNGRSIELLGLFATFPNKMKGFINYFEFLEIRGIILLHLCFEYMSKNIFLFPYNK